MYVIWKMGGTCSIGVNQSGVEVMFFKDTCVDMWQRE